jgi:hypothetical protein
LFNSVMIASLLVGVLALMMASFLLLLYLRIRRLGKRADGSEESGQSASAAADAFGPTSGRLQSR